MVAGAVAEALGLPAPWLLAGLLGGLTVALARGESLETPPVPTVAAQAVVGVALGASIAPGALAGLAGTWWLVLGAVALTLGSAVAVALVLARVSGLDRATAAIGLVPGAAPALIAVGDDVGADARLVAVMQYARVLLVVATVPLVALALGPEGEATAMSTPPAGPAGPAPVLAAVGVGAAGALVATLLRAPAAALVGPLVLGALATASGIVALAIPEPLAHAAFVVVGASVGLRFDRRSLRRAGRLAPSMAGALVAVALLCASVGLVLLVALDTDPLTAYLATTPGGISSVLAVALDTGADLTIVVAVQTLRLLLLAAVAPFAARRLRVPPPT